MNVRHPFERLVSAFLDKGPGHNDCTSCTFKQFITYFVLERANASIDQTKLEAMNIHWRPYHTHCSFCNVSYSYISKTETFDEDKARILEMLGVNVNTEGERRNIRGGSKIGNETKKYFQNITEDIKAQLLELYKFEFALFNYNNDLY